jgi:hypothetical protein
MKYLGQVKQGLNNRQTLRCFSTKSPKQRNVVSENIAVYVDSFGRLNPLPSKADEFLAPAAAAVLATTAA